MTNDDLRTALTKLAVPMYYDATPGAYPVTAVPMSHLLSLLAAHPAPECECVVTAPDVDGTTNCPAHAPVSDTRREDDDLVETIARALLGVLFGSVEECSPAEVVYARHLARAVLAALPAPLEAAHLIAVVVEHEPRLDETACYDGGCLCGWYGTETEHEAHRLAAVTEALALPAPPVEHLTFGGERCVYCGANYLDAASCEVADPGERRVRFMRALGEFRDQAAALPVVDDIMRDLKAEAGHTTFEGGDFPVYAVPMYVVEEILAAHLRGETRG